MYILPKEVKEIVDNIGPVVIIGSEDALNKLVNDKIKYPVIKIVSFKYFYDKDTNIKYLASDALPGDHNDIYIIPRGRYDYDKENYTIHFRVPESNQPVG